MDDRENLENLAFKRSILPVFFYFSLCFILFFLIEQVTSTATNFLGNENIKLVNVLKGIVLGLLTTFLVFFLIYKYKFIELNAIRNVKKMVVSSPYPVVLFQFKSQSVIAASNAFSRLMGYSVNETKQLLIGDLLTEFSSKILMEQKLAKETLNHDFPELHLVQKNKQILSIAVNVMNFELLDKEYLIFNCHHNIPLANLSLEESSMDGADKPRNFSF